MNRFVILALFIALLIIVLGIAVGWLAQRYDDRKRRRVK